MSPLTVDQVRSYIFDYAPGNYLIDGQEFSDQNIELCMALAVDEFNFIPPTGAVTLETFPSTALLLQGTLWKLFEGKAAHFARNHMNYSDGGLQLNVEERWDIYKNLAASAQQQFLEMAGRLKIHANMESGWGDVRGDASTFPYW